MIWYVLIKLTVIYIGPADKVPLKSLHAFKLIYVWVDTIMHPQDITHTMRNIHRVIALIKLWLFKIRFALLVLIHES